MILNLKNFFAQIYISRRFYLAMFVLAIIYILAQYVHILVGLALIAQYVFITLCLADIYLLFSGEHIQLERHLPERLSNGDYNPISYTIFNKSPLKLSCEIIDELPHQLQIRDFSMQTILKPQSDEILHYSIRPTYRGEYKFGLTRIFTQSILGIFIRRYTAAAPCTIPVYPSFVQLHKFEFLAISNRLTDAGIKKIRRISQNQEFEQIKEYIPGDDYRTINWKATARSNKLMVNQYQQERAQHVYCLIDMGRTMKMPFNHLSLLDYAINASLVMSKIAMIKHDKAGLFTFSSRMHTKLKASNDPHHMHYIMEALYAQQTKYDESNFEALYQNIRAHVKQRSLLILFTNMETITAMQRYMPFLRRLVANHVLITVFFENTEIKDLAHSHPSNVSQIYEQTIAEKLMYEKRLIVKELNNYGIHTLLTDPAELTIGVINKYLEMKSKGLI